MGKKVLLADDSATTRKMVEIALRETEFELQEASNGKQAIDQLATFQPDIVLADAIMPEMDGYEVCQFIKAMPKYRHIPVVLLTTRFQLFDEMRAEEVGIDLRVNKPLSEHQLISIINDLVQPDGKNADQEPSPEAKTFVEELEETAPLDTGGESSSSREEPSSVEGDLNESTVQMSAADIQALLKEDRTEPARQTSRSEEESPAPTLDDMDENNVTVQMNPSQIQELIKGDNNNFESTVKMTPEELMRQLREEDSEGETEVARDDNLPTLTSFEVEEEVPVLDDDEHPVALDFTLQSVPDTLELAPEDLEDLPPDQRAQQLPEGAFDTLPGSFSRNNLIAEDANLREMQRAADGDSRGEEAEIDTEILSEELPELDLDDTGSAASSELPPESGARASRDDRDERGEASIMELDEEDLASEEDVTEEEIRFAQTRPAPSANILDDSGELLLPDEASRNANEEFFDLPEPGDAGGAPIQDLLEEVSLEELDDTELEPLDEAQRGPEKQKARGYLEEEGMTTGPDWEEEQLSPTTPIEESAEALTEDDFRLELEEELDPDLIEDSEDSERLKAITFDDGDGLLEESLPLEADEVGEPSGEILDTEPVAETAGASAAEEDTEPLDASTEDEPLLLEEEKSPTEEELSDTAPIPRVRLGDESETQAGDATGQLPPLGTPADVDEQDTEPIESTASAGLTEEQLNRLADMVVERVLERISSNTIQDAVWQVVPELSEAMIKKRIFQLEQSVDQD